MDPFAKYLPVAKTKLDLSKINNEDDLKKFCIDFLEKKGYSIEMNIPIPITPTYPSISHGYNYSNQIIMASYAIPRDLLMGAHNVQGLRMQVEQNLYGKLMNQIAAMNITEMKTEQNYATDQNIYTMRLGVFKP